MKTIPLTKGYEAVVDDEDFEWLSKHSWHVALGSSKPYASTRFKINGKPTTICMHRVIMGAPGDGRCVDHINGDGLDNRRANLRQATASQNNANTRVVYNLHGFKGVECRGNFWRVNICVLGNKIRLSGFKTASEAAAEYDRLALLHFGEFAATNKGLGLLP